MKTYSVIMIVYVSDQTGEYGYRVYCFDFDMNDPAIAKEKLLMECRRILKRFKNRGHKYAAIECAPLRKNGRFSERKLLQNRRKFSSLATILNPRMTAEKLFVEGSGPKAWAEVIKK